MDQGSIYGYLWFIDDDLSRLAFAYEIETNYDVWAVEVMSRALQQGGSVQDLDLLFEGISRSCHRGTIELMSHYILQEHRKS